MQAENKHKYLKLQELIEILHNESDKRKSLDIGLELANSVLSVLGANENSFLYGEDALNKAFSNAKFKNQKMETWFKKHPYFKSARVAINLFEESEAVYESNFYWLNESATKARISSTVMLNPNWEDSELTMLPSYKIGIDFFLNNSADTLSIVISKNGNLRVLELSEKLSNTQIEIFDNVRNCLLFDGIDPKTGKVAEKEPQQTIHRKLWDAFELKEVNKKFYIGIADHFERLCQYMEKDAIIQKIQYINKKRVQNFSNRLIGRLLFLWFLRKRNIIDESQNYFVIGELKSSEYYEKKLKPLFFETLNKSIEKRTTNDKKTPYLNGGLFEAHEDDFFDIEISYPEDWFYTLYNHLDGFNFTTDESTPEYQQVAIDPEMLGRVFENLLASIRPETSSAANERKNKGAFYTPREIVDFMCKESLKEYIKSTLENEKDYFGVDRLIDMNDSDFLEQKSTGVSELWGNRSSSVKEKIISILNEIKILDPACGSGAFPIGMLQLIVKTLDRLTAFYDDKLAKHRLARSNEKTNLYSTKLAIIKNSLYGVDIEPMAIEISRLRSWLSLIIDEGNDIKPLPNLDFNFVCANSLLPLIKRRQFSIFDDYSYEDSLKSIREEFFSAHSSEKKLELKDTFSKIYSKELTENDAIQVIQLQSWNPFDSNTSAKFFDSKTMFNIDSFNIVIGNPPYIHFEDIKIESKKIYKPIGYQTYEARGDIYSLFYEMGTDNLCQNGVLCYISSNKWMKASYGKSLRNYFIEKANPKLLVDLGSGVFDNATVDTNIILLSKNKYDENTLSLKLEKKNRICNLKNMIAEKAIEITYYKDNPWIISNEIEESILNKVKSMGLRLSEWPNIEVNRGVVTGFNDAFIISSETRDRILQACNSKEELEMTKNILVPILRGKDISKYEYSHQGLYLVALFPAVNYDISKYPAIERYLKSFPMEKLEQSGETHRLKNGKIIKSRKKTSNKWYETQDSIKYYKSYLKKKIFYREISDRMSSVLVDEEIYTNNKIYVITGSYMHTLVAYLNSSIFEKIIFRRFNLTGGKGSETLFLTHGPIPNENDEEVLKDLVMKRQKYYNDNKVVHDLDCKIDNLFFSIFRLTEKEKNYLRDS